MAQWLKRGGFFGSILVAGFLIGAAAFWFVFRYLPPQEVKVGPWRANPAIGIDDADLLTRTRTAMTILVAIRQSEFVYYFASVDSDGTALHGDCAYRLQGPQPEAEFWSVVAYNDGGFLDPSPIGRFSVNQNDRESDMIDVRVAATGSGPTWLPAPDARLFNLVMRLYRPSEGVVADLSTVSLPTIEKMECAR